MSYRLAGQLISRERRESNSAPQRAASEAPDHQNES
jgi:hypothetical protein